MTSFSLPLKQFTEGQRETLQNYGGFRLPRCGKRESLQLNLKILMREMIKEVFFFFPFCNSRYTKHAPQSQSGVNDSLKVISVHFLLPGEQETETGERGTDLKIDRKSEKGTDKRVQIRKV